MALLEGRGRLGIVILGRLIVVCERCSDEPPEESIVDVRDLRSPWPTSLGGLPGGGSVALGRMPI